MEVNTAVDLFGFYIAEYKLSSTENILVDGSLFSAEFTSCCYLSEILAGLLVLQFYQGSYSKPSTFYILPKPERRHPSSCKLYLLQLN